MNYIRLIVFLVLVSVNGIGESRSFNYKREIQGISNEWHRIILPDDIFDKVKTDFSDLRIIGINHRDTVEIPFILNIKSDKNIVREESFRIINRSENRNGFYYTFELPIETSINQILPEFRLTNFDWRIDLEGSHDLNSWFTIIKNYRISAFHRDSASFQYSRIVFPDSKFRYFRLLVKSDIDPEFVSVKLNKIETIAGETRSYHYKLAKTEEDKKTKKSIYHLVLPQSVPVAVLGISIKDTIDYYRPVKIDYVCDSTQTSEGWNYIYSNLADGIVNSMDKNAVGFSNTILKKIRITITNNDNQPLRIDSFNVKGYVYELTGHFGQYSSYYLVYGNKRISNPSYDLEHFRSKIPAEMSTAVLGKEQPVSSAPRSWTFFNTSLLWLTMIGIIILLSGFTIKMIRNKKPEN